MPGVWPSATRGYWTIHPLMSRSQRPALLVCMVCGTRAVVQTACLYACYFGSYEQPVRAMAQIRAVQPEARLIQTDDLDYVHSTPGLQYQADFKNARRWLTWDLLCGRVMPDHDLWAYLRGAGATDHELWYHVEKPCPPSVVGINHYVTSERYLYESLNAHKTRTHTTIGGHRYVDTEVVRAAPEQRMGVGNLLLQTWERYGLPLVVTEAHLGDRVDEQKRWLGEVWQQAGMARLAGADVRAVTVWALLGLYDWHCLLTRRDDLHEPGAFDVRSGRTEPTGLADMIRLFAAGHPVASLIPPGRGWWQANEASLQPSSGLVVF